MPVAQGGAPPLRQVAMIGLGVVMTMGTILFLVTQMDNLLGGVGDIDLDIGDGIYRPGPAADLASAVEEGPLLLPDLAGGDSDFFLQHLGDDVDEGWIAIAARPQTAARHCFVEWKADERSFVDSCDGATYPEDGAGLPHHPVRVTDEGDIEVEVNVVIPPSVGQD
ncbi:MAG: hypothetical protein GY724_10990 [Actinomycetia bacterium]|nr:hypothetical protein [Actinomycetes bacterium]MCP5035818.1 hypothetical protein [Actinomycetes bacterium]